MLAYNNYNGVCDTEGYIHAFIDVVVHKKLMWACECVV